MISALKPCSIFFLLGHSCLLLGLGNSYPGSCTFGLVKTLLTRDFSTLSSRLPNIIDWLKKKGTK